MGKVILESTLTCPECEHVKTETMPTDASLSEDQRKQAEWWKLFNDPVLNTLVQRAYRQNLPLQVAACRISFT